MKRKYISPEDVVSTLDGSNGRFMSVKFVKRTDNSMRSMNCRRGVKKGIKGGGASTKDRRRRGLYTVYDMVAKGWRSINISGVHEIRMNKTIYTVRA